MPNTPRLALKVSLGFNVAFAVGMCFFTDQMVAVYKAESFKGLSKTAFMAAMVQVGSNQVQMMLFCATMSKSKNEAAKSCACLCVGFAWIFFGIADCYILSNGGIPTSIVPASSIHSNLILFLIIGGINLLAWNLSGGVLPEFSDFVVRGDLSNPINLGSANFLLFGLWMALLTPHAFDTFLPGVMETLPGQGTIAPMLYWVYGNAGKGMLINILSIHAVISVDPKCNDTKYRLLRSMCYSSLFWLGSFAKDGALFDLAGWPAPMRVFTFVSCAGTWAYQANALGDVDVKVPAKIKKT